MIIPENKLRQELVQRRQSLLRAMKQYDEKSIAILPAAHLITRNGDVTFPFHQESNFSYLTGFPEPDAIAVFVPNRPEGEFILFNHPLDPSHEIWHGQRIGQENACQYFDADQAFPLQDLDQEISKLLQGCDSIYYPIGQTSKFDQRIIGWLNTFQTQARSGHKFPQQIKSIRLLLDEIRLFKRPFEIELMRQAARISVAAHQRAMRAAKHAHWEYELAAELVYECRKQGCQHLAYESIVAAGANACILHYTDNNSPLKDGDLILIDAAAEYQGYAADITRTFPRNGRFTSEQKAIYEIVLAAQHAGISKLNINRHNQKIRWNDVQTTIVHVITEGLIALGILKGERDNLIENRAYHPFYMHNFGHWLGMDVHDVGTYKNNHLEWRTLEPQMTLTVEPGLYIRPNKEVDPRWWNIGIRIEDDVLITQGEPEVLTAGLIKNVADIESFMQHE